MIRLVRESDARATVRFDEEVHVVDVELPRRTAGATQVWVISRAFADYEVDGRVVHIELLLPLRLLHFCDLLMPRPADDRFALFVEKPVIAGSEEYFYDPNRKILRIAFSKTSATTNFFYLGDGVAIEEAGNDLVALWFSDFPLTEDLINGAPTGEPGGISS
jgi:hypothetical protein